MLKNIEKKANEFTNVEEVKKELRNVQSRKSRLRKRKTQENYENLMKELLEEEQILKEVRDYFEPKSIPTTQFTKKDIELLNYEETLRAIKSIQSKKCNSQFLTENINNNEEYQKACEIEEMLLDHKENVKPIEESVVKKSTINEMINHLENLDEELSKEYLLEMLSKLTN